MRRRLAVILAQAALLVSGCANAPRGPAPLTMTAAVAPTGFPATVRYVGVDRAFFLTHMEEDTARLRRATGGGSLNILALSGGGAGGAFGAGALVGSSRRPDHPQFTVVTGVSTGALLAPFAYLGPDWNPQLTEAFGGDRAEHLLRSRGLGFLFSPGFYQGRPLARLVDEFVTDDLIRAVAVENTKGRLLLVATTDLDKQETVIWDMGAIASKGGPAARDLFAKVLLASATIPGVFPPVLIPVEGGGKSYVEMHVDGGTTVPFFFASELAYVVPLEFEKLKDANLYVLVAGQLVAQPQTTRATTVEVLVRSFDATLRRSTRTTVELSAAFAHRYGVNFRFTQIPTDYPFGGPIDFKATATRALFAYGMRCAEQGRLWTTIDQATERNEPALASNQTLAPADVDCPLLSKP